MRKRGAYRKVQSIRELKYGNKIEPVKQKPKPHYKNAKSAVGKNINNVENITRADTKLLDNTGKFKNQTQENNYQAYVKRKNAERTNF